MHSIERDSRMGLQNISDSQTRFSDSMIVDTKDLGNLFSVLVTSGKYKSLMAKHVISLQHFNDEKFGS